MSTTGLPATSKVDLPFATRGRACAELVLELGAGVTGALRVTTMVDVGNKLGTDGIGTLSIPNHATRFISTSTMFANSVRSSVSSLRRQFITADSRILARLDTAQRTPCTRCTSDVNPAGQGCDRSYRQVCASRAFHERQPCYAPVRLLSCCCSDSGYTRGCTGENEDI